MSEGVRTLSERERETLRLLLLGHDAKSIAVELELSVHTVNERLREARRKLGVSSSREAARTLAESLDPEFFGDKRLGVGAATVRVPHIKQPNQTNGLGHPFAWLGGGMLVMSLLIAALVFLSPSHTQTIAPAEVASPRVTSAVSGRPDLAAEVEAMARDTSEAVNQVSFDSARFREFLQRQVYLRGLSEAAVFKVTKGNRIEPLALLNVGPSALEAISAKAASAGLRANSDALIVSTKNRRGAVVRLSNLDNIFLYAGRS